MLNDDIVRASFGIPRPRTREEEERLARREPPRRTILDVPEERLAEWRREVDDAIAALNAQEQQQQRGRRRRPTRPRPTSPAPSRASVATGASRSQRGGHRGGQRGGQPGDARIPSMGTPRQNSRQLNRQPPPSTLRSNDVRRLDNVFQHAPRPSVARPMPSARESVPATTSPFNWVDMDIGRQQSRQQQSQPPPPPSFPQRRPLSALRSLPSAASALPAGLETLYQPPDDRLLAPRSQPTRAQAHALVSAQQPPPPPQPVRRPSPAQQPPLRPVQRDRTALAQAAPPAPSRQAPSAQIQLPGRGENRVAFPLASPLGSRTGRSRGDASSQACSMFEGEFPAGLSNGPADNARNPRKRRDGPKPFGDNNSTKRVKRDANDESQIFTDITMVDDEVLLREVQARLARDGERRKREGKQDEHEKDRNE